MLFNHYGGEAARLAADLVNSPVALPAAELEPILAGHGIAASLTERQAKQVWAWGRRLAACFGGQEVQARCQAINRLLEETASRPYISLHDGHPHLHYSSHGADRVAQIRASTAAGLAYVVCFAGAHRLGRCAREGCRRAYVDTSRNGRRAYCTVRCANNDAVARHREHRRDAADTQLPNER